MWGWSAGGSHALACAALLPDLVAAVASLASPAPGDAEGLDWLAGFGQEEFFRLLLTDRLRPARRWTRTGMRPWPPRRTIWLRRCPRRWVPCCPRRMRPCCRGEWPATSRPRCRTGSRPAPGAVGRLLRCCCPAVGVCAGRYFRSRPTPTWRAGRVGPVRHGQWLAVHIPGAQVKPLDHEGHLSLVEHQVGDVHSWLAEHLHG